MAMRDLVTGGAACAVPGSSSSSNPLGALANSILGSSSKTQERLKEIPTSATTTSDGNFYPGTDEQLTMLPGSEFDQPPQPNVQGSNFLRGFRSADQSRLADVWDEIHNPQVPHSEGRDSLTNLPVTVHTIEANTRLQRDLHGPPQRVLSSLLHSFVNSSQGGIPFRPTPLPILGLSEGDKQCIGDRSCIMARHFFADKSEDFINAQEQSQIASVNQVKGANIPNLAAMEKTRMLAHTLAQNNDPKFQNSKFLQFVSKMSRGEITIEDNQFQPTAVSAPEADQFMHDEHSRREQGWVNEFVADREQHGSVDDQWVNEFSKLHVQDWVDEFGHQDGEGALGENSADNRENAYDEYLNEQVNSKQRSDTSRGVYEFSDMNPYVGRANPLKEGQELFRKGLLSEAVLAFEAEVLKNPNNMEGWRLLGIAHAENDDDQQAIAAMMRAQEVDPTNLEVLLALGASHTNELEQAAALKYLYSWLCHHPKYGTLAPPEISDSLYHADVARLFNDAAQMSPEDADVHIVLGVLCILSREYDKAIAYFQTALKLKPRDYSLWNKLGATQANSGQSADAIQAYQQALELKPNYVRAWANMGISYADQGMYEESIRYYVRALAMNPKADNAWQYLRISLSCASRNDMLEACDSRNLDFLQKEFPL